MDTIDCPKCEHEHLPTGSHEDDSGEMECEVCGFKFEVEVEYDPVYSTRCVEHEYGPFEQKSDRRGELVEGRFCVHCQTCQFQEKVVT
jgi:transcription elongation factor Elf1